jgi:Transposase DDE domain group 1
MHTTSRRRPKLVVSADGKGLVSGAGGLLVAEVLRVTGLGAGLSAGLARWRAARAVHDPGKVIADLAVALGGDCLADIGVLRAEPELYGLVASDPVVSRTIGELAADPVRSVKAIRAARAAAPERAWAMARSAAPGADGGLITVDDLDATLVTSYSEKENAPRPTWKKTFGFHPLAAPRRQCPLRQRCARKEAADPFAYLAFHLSRSGYAASPGRGATMVGPVPGSGHTRRQRASHSP